MTGVIIKALSGVYSVRADEAGTVYRCKAKGRFRYENTSPLVGDDVDFSPEEHIVERIRPRRNSFIRPPVANVDFMVIVAAAVNPITDPFLIDRMAVIAAMSDVLPVICLNKCDLDSADTLFDIYTRAGFPVFRVSAETGEGAAELHAYLRGKTAVFTGNSGVGKSSILNALGLNIETGEVSEKLGRGRHTTRHTEIHDVDGALIIDTPGFSSFDTAMMDRLPREDLERAFIDFVPHLGICRFRDCAHINEPDCAVLNAVKNGKIVKSRHTSYLRLTELERELKAKEYK